jgi:hypothetical protein
MIFLTVAIVIKLALVAMRGSTTRNAMPGMRFVLILVGLWMFSMAAASDKEISAAVQLLAFIVSMLLTLYLTSGDRLVGDYSRAFLNCVTVVIVVYLLLALTGNIHVTYGRYSYFNEDHPNLGSGVGAIAIIASTFVIAMRGAGEYRRLLERQPALVVIGSAIALAVLLLKLAPMLVSVGRTVLMVDDVCRGGGTGFVGRFERWQTAFDLFTERLIFRNGSAVYDSLGVEAPHSFFMFGLANLGLTFLVVLRLIGWHVYRSAREQPRAMLLMAPVAILLFFNDRFINMALYPFVAYVFLFSLSAPKVAMKAASGWQADPRPTGGSAMIPVRWVRMVRTCRELFAFRGSWCGWPTNHICVARGLQT